MRAVAVVVLILYRRSQLPARAVRAAAVRAAATLTVGLQRQERQIAVAAAVARVLVAEQLAARLVAMAL
jgi:redox-regulated HSP33 family molecular chaperone